MTRLLNELTLLHYSRFPLTHDALFVKDQIEPGAYRKPCGLWVSVEGEDDWASWCKSESFGIGRLIHRITLAPDANILLCSDKLDLYVFTERYVEECGRYRYRGINWRRVAAEYDGIIIAPYQWECRLNDYTEWYYGWDCASGCVWEPRAVVGVEFVGELAGSSSSSTVIEEVSSAD